MKVILLAGGLGTRISEYTESIPKPMIIIGEKPILWHIMKTYSSFGHKDFFVALGYKGALIKEYFLHYHNLNADFKVNLGTGKITPYQLDDVDWDVTMVDTGQETMTGGRVKRIRPFIGNETCMMTYGDGVTDLDLDKLHKFHKSHGKLITMTAVRPGARFGELELEDSLVTSFVEKPQLGQGWINGGYFIIEPDFFDMITSDSEMLEREPLEKVVQLGELMAYKHEGFWKCMDTKRDFIMLNKLWDKGNAPWKC